MNQRERERERENEGGETDPLSWSGEIEREGKLGCFVFFSFFLINDFLGRRGVAEI